MSTHPNAVLLLTLTTDSLSRITMRDILLESGINDDGDDIKIGSQDYHHRVLEEDFEDGYQLSGKPGDLLFFDFVTYGYGEQITWEKLESQKNELEEWAKGICARHHCNYKISVTANYW